MIPDSSRTELSRRTVVRGAAWAVPTIAIASAVPNAAASIATATFAQTNSQTGLLTLRLLDGTGTVTAGALVTVPTEYTLTNTPGAISTTGTVTVTVSRPSGINIPVGRARGFGVAAFNGTNSTSGERTTTYQTTLGAPYGFPNTTFTRSGVAVNVASNGSRAFSISFGLAGVSTGVTISALATFAVNVQLAVPGKIYSASGTISVPVGAGIL